MSMGPSGLSGRLTAVFSFRSFHLLLLLLTGCASLFFVIHTVRFLPVIGDNMHPEAAGVIAAQRWAHGLPLYDDYRHAPYIVTAFTPLWYGIMALASKLGHLDLDALTLFGRGLSLLCLLGLVSVGYRWNRRLGHSPSLALLTPAFYLSFPILIPWAVTARPDLPSLFLVLLALYWAAFRPSPGAVCVAAVLAGLAFLIRHNAVAVPVALVLWMVWNKRWKHAFLFCAVWGVVVGSTFAVFQKISHGMFLLNLSGAQFGTFAGTYVHDIVGRLLNDPGHGFAVALFAFGLFGFLAVCRNGNSHTALLGLYLVITLGLATLGSAAAGAAVNHYLEPALALALLVPSGLAWLQNYWHRDSPLAAFAVVFLLMFLLPSLDEQRFELSRTRPENFKQFLPLLATQHVFTDIPYLSARKPQPEFVDLAALYNTENAGPKARWSPDALAQDLQQKKYDLLILNELVTLPYVAPGRYPRYPRLDAEVYNAIGHNYTLCFAAEASYVYAPLPQDPYTPTACPAGEWSGSTQDKRDSSELGR
ncbi:MAG: glycosyltransferase family 39 protein [Acidobacteria bacterium]|nr:glycosyltransferase family 39 protein [Acidobacteriota bacterium]